jgi:hypothetical protein
VSKEINSSFKINSTVFTLSNGLTILGDLFAPTSENVVKNKDGK